MALCASVMLTGCVPYTPVNQIPSNSTPIKSQQTANKGYSRDWGAIKDCNKGYCFWRLGTRIQGNSNSVFEMTFHNGSLMMSRLVLSLNNYPPSSYVNNGQLYITIDGEKTFTFDAAAYISSNNKHVPVIFTVSKDTEPALIYYMTHGYNASIVLEGEAGGKFEMNISLMGFTKMLRLARQ